MVIKPKFTENELKRTKPRAASLRPINPTHGEKVPSSFSMPCSAALRQRRSVEFPGLEPVGEVQLGQLAVVVVNALVSASS